MQEVNQYYINNVDNVQFKLIMISPETAQELLKKVSVNRNIRKVMVAQYVNDIRNNRWDTQTGETIKFDTKGNLIDGQHRLLAIIQTGQTVPVHIAYNCSINAQRVIDGGGRNVADMLKVSGVGKPDEVALVLKSFAAYVKQKELLSQQNEQLSDSSTIKKKFVKSALTKQVLYEIYLEHQALINSTIEAYSPIVYKKDRVILCKPSLLLRFAVILAYEGASYEKISDYLEQMGIGEGNILPSIHYVRTELHRTQQRHSVIPAPIFDEYLYRSWNYFMTNNQAKKIRIKNELPKLLIG